MSRPFRCRMAEFASLATLTAGLMFVSSLQPRGAVAQEGKAEPKQEKPAPASPHAWTLDAALEQLQLYPRDPYLQYVALQLARRDGRGEEAVRQIAMPRDTFEGGGRGRVGDVDLFSLFSGALAVQESLQLDSLLGRQRQPRVPGPPGTVKVSTLRGPTIQSHPWEKMLAGRKPEVSQLARSVPEDFYFIEFQSLNKLLEVVEQSDLWSTHVVSQSEHDARTQLVAERLKEQLAIQTTGLLRPFYDTIVRDVAITGSDLYLREGSDVTMLFRAKQPLPFRVQMDGFLASAQKKFPDARRSEGQYLDVPYVHVETPDRRLHVYSAYPAPDMHVRSNSKFALERVLAAIRGVDAQGRPVKRLGDSTEFAYIRTLMPMGTAEEDGFVYLSDPFIRRLVGPQVKLTERRRLVCYNQLRMIGHASLLHATQEGRLARSLGELAKSGCAPGTFGQGALTCPDHGEYTLSADGLFGVCSHHGQADALAPIGEIEVDEVTTEEAAEYEQFLQEYNQYWRTFFDPIALRIKATPERYRIETIVLPLIENTIYSQLAQTLGEKPEPLDALPVPDRNIFTLAMRFDKQAIARQMGVEEMLLADLGAREEPAAPRAGRVQEDSRRMARRFQQMALALHNYHDTYGRFPTAVSIDDQGKRTKLSWRVHLLPFLEQAELYSQFKLDEPWDSETNKKLIARMPDIFHPGDAKLAAAGKTRIVAPRGDKLLFSNAKNGARMADVLDGTSNTLMLVEADDAHAVVWTSPVDLDVNLDKPLDGLRTREPEMFLAAYADGSINGIRRTIPPQQLAAAFTRAGGEASGIPDEFRVAVVGPDSRSSGGLFGLADDEIRDLRLGEFLIRGIGNQYSLNVYDAEPTFGFSLTSFLGRTMGSFGGRSLMGPDSEVLIFGALAASLQAPVYVALPVQDPAVVDAFLERFDKFVARASRQQQPFGGFFRLSQDFYYLDDTRGKPARGYVLEVGPIKWRFFWSRIENGLYIASRPFILDDLRTLHASAAKRPAGAGPVDAGPTAHAMLRLRPAHWKQVLKDYELGWAENNRTACIHNLGPLSSLARASAALAPEASTAERLAQVQLFASKVYGAHHFCPEEGEYTLDKDGRTIVCKVHGTALDPHQHSASQSHAARLGRSLHELSDIVLSLTFLEDGLHGVVVIERKGGRGADSDHAERK